MPTDPPDTQAPKELSNFLFWEVTSKDSSGKLYLLGSIHVADESIYPFPDTIMSAFDESDILAVELDIVALEKDFEQLMELSALMVYPDFGKISDHMPAELYEKAKAFLKEANAYNFVYEYMVPTAWNTLIDEVIVKGSGLDSKNGVDLYFLNLAKKQNMPIHELETAKLQYDILFGVPEELTYLFIESTISNKDKAISEMRQMYDLWKSADIVEFEKLILEYPKDLTSELDEMYHSYNKALVEDRNKEMAKAGSELLLSGQTVFYIVGAGHMVGPTGLVTALEDYGYSVVLK